jgi:hypothetical protein
MTDDQRVSTTLEEPGNKQRQFTFKATQVVLLAGGLLEGLIGLRILFKLIGASTAASFTGLLYSITDVFLIPFAELTGTPSSGNLVLEVSSLIAMLVYALMFWVIERLVWVVFYRPRTGEVNTHTTIVDRNTP